MKKELLYLLARVGLLDGAAIEDARERQVLLRGVCPVHEGADCPTAFVVRTDKWFCNTRECHDEYGSNLEGLIVGLAHRYGGAKKTFREAKGWVKRHIRALQAEFASWPTVKASGGSGRSRGEADGRFPCPRSLVLEGLVIPDWYFQRRGFRPETLRPFDIGWPRPGGFFGHEEGVAIVPLYHLADPDCCVGYAARKTTAGAEPRWRFSRGFPCQHRLFNFPSAEKAVAGTGRLLLVEGVPDALRCVEAGFPQVVALLGSSILPEQEARLKALRPREVVVLADNDDAGRKLVVGAKKVFSATSTEVRAVYPPKAVKDVGELSTSEAHNFLRAVTDAGRAESPA